MAIGNNSDCHKSYARACGLTRVARKWYHVNGTGTICRLSNRQAVDQNLDSVPFVRNGMRGYFIYTFGMGKDLRGKCHHSRLEIRD